MFPRSRMIPLVLASTALFVVAWPASVFAASSPRLGTVQNFAVLAGSTITNTGATVVTGELGLSPGTSLTGFPPGVVNGTKHLADGAALQAKTDLITAYNDAANSPTTINLTGENLGNKNLEPGRVPIQLVGAAHRSADAERTWSLRLQNRELADHGESLRGPSHQRRPGMSGLLAGWIVGDSRNDHHVCRKSHGAHQHHADDRRQRAGRASSCSQRRRDPARKQRPQTHRLMSCRLGDHP